MSRIIKGRRERERESERQEHMYKVERSEISQLSNSGLVVICKIEKSKHNKESEKV